MAKKSGLGDELFFGGYQLSNDIQQLSVGMPSALLEVPGINSSAMERVYGKRDGQINFTSYFNDAAGRAHPVLSARPSTDVQLLYCRGTTLGDPACGQVAKQVGYDPARGEDGSLLMTVQTLANLYPAEWGKQLTAGLDNITGAGNGTGVDFGTGSTAFGLAAYLQVTGFSGTSVTFTLEESSDDASSDAYAPVTGGAFTAVAAANVVQRIETSLTQTVERYLRWSAAGTFSSCDFVLMVIRYGGANRET